MKKQSYHAATHPSTVAHPIMSAAKIALNFGSICDDLTEIRICSIEQLLTMATMSTNKTNAKPENKDPAAIAALF
jgi:hypothetical protein